MKLPIITDMKILRQKSEPVANWCESQKILQDLSDSLDKSRGCGLAGVQVGILKQVAIVRLGGIAVDLVDAYIVDKIGKFRMVGESCLSIPAIKIDTLRYKEIVYINNGVERFAEGIEALAIQHEIDHLHGITMLDRKWRSQ